MYYIIFIRNKFFLHIFTILTIWIRVLKLTVIALECFWIFFCVKLLSYLYIDWHRGIIKYSSYNNHRRKASRGLYHKSIVLYGRVFVKKSRCPSLNIQTKYSQNICWSRWLIFSVRCNKFPQLIYKVAWYQSCWSCKFLTNFLQSIHWLLILTFVTFMLSQLIKVS